MAQFGAPQTRGARSLSDVGKDLRSSYTRQSMEPTAVRSFAAKATQDDMAIIGSGLKGAPEGATLNITTLL